MPKLISAKPVATTYEKISAHSAEPILTVLKHIALNAVAHVAESYAQYVTH